MALAPRPRRFVGTPLERDRGSPAVRVWLVSLESPLELGETLAILIKLGLEFLQLR